MIQIEPIAFNAFQVNTYLVWDETGDCLVVDPAFYDQKEQQTLESFVRDKGLKITGQINTHCHVDHVLGVNYMKSEHGAAFRAHRNELPIVEKTQIMGDLFGWSIDTLDIIDEFIPEGQEIQVGKHSLRTIFVPGHSPGSIAFYSKEGAFVITGDALFQNSIGRTDLPGGDYDTLIQSIRDALLVLPPETLVWPGHGPSTTIGKEKLDNPFLRAAQ